MVLQILNKIRSQPGLKVVTGRFLQIETRPVVVSTCLYDDTHKMADRIKASEILGRSHGDFIQKIEVANEVSEHTDAELDEKIRSL